MAEHIAPHGRLGLATIGRDFSYTLEWHYSLGWLLVLLRWLREFIPSALLDMLKGLMQEPAQLLTYTSAKSTGPPVVSNASKGLENLRYIYSV